MTFMKINKWTVNRVLDTLNKYSNHQILDITQYDNYIKLTISYYSEKFNSKTETIVLIYCDNYLGEK